MNEFNYLIEKIQQANFEDVPFEHIIINNFFTEEHFQKVTNSKQIKLPPFSSNREVVESLKKSGYTPQIFPGCITDEEEYIQFADGQKELNRDLIDGYGKHVIEGYGLTMRLERIEDPFLKQLYEFLNSSRFTQTLIEKFDLAGEISIETAYQKNLMHYEISPHCDTSRKALTYMVNIYNKDDCENREMHTHFCKLKPEYEYIYSIWKNSDFDPVWIPWNWCETVKKTNTNNSISIFKPSYNTLHAVKISEEHFEHQRNQIYGNLWYPESQKKSHKGWKDLDIYNNYAPQIPTQNMTFKSRLKNKIKRTTKSLLGQ